MKGLSLRNIAKITGGLFRLSLLYSDGTFETVNEEQILSASSCTRDVFAPLLDTEVNAITTDSRLADEGCLFGAIVGSRADGHGFIPDVFDRGAVCVLSERNLDREDLFGCTSVGESMGKVFATGSGPLPRAWILVKDTIGSLALIAKEYLRILNISVIGVTGSVGKTSTKEMIASVLSAKFRTLKTEGNLNNDLGLPLTVFRLTDQDRIAVLEMGISHFGDMARLADIARPDTFVITNIGTCHLEFLHDRDGVFRAKTEAFKYLKDGASTILNGCDDRLRSVTSVRGRAPIFFGIDSKEEIARKAFAETSVCFPGRLSSDRCVCASDIRLEGLSGSTCIIHTWEGDMRVRIPVPGIHNVSNAAAATAAGLMYGLTLQEIKGGLESVKPLSGRFRVIEAGGLTVIDDCYNANPMSVTAALSVLAKARGRRVAILGDMGELGNDEIRLHREMGAYVAHNADKLIAIGALSRLLYEAALRERPCFDAKYYKNVDDFLEHKDVDIQEGDTILVKASHFMEFHYIVETLLKQ